MSPPSTPKPTHRRDGTFRRGNQAAFRGALARVVLPAQRVAPATLASLRAAAPAHGGIGRAIDAAVAGLAAAVGPPWKRPPVL